MRAYILSRPKGTFKDATLKVFVKREWITEEDYKKLSENTESTANND